MAERFLYRRFGNIAIQKGFITKEQFIEAMAMQIESEVDGGIPLTLGAILNRMGYMTPQQIDEVLETIGIPFKRL